MTSRLVKFSVFDDGFYLQQSVNNLPVRGPLFSDFLTFHGRSGSTISGCSGGLGDEVRKIEQRAIRQTGETSGRSKPIVLKKRKQERCILVCD